MDELLVVVLSMLLVIGLIPLYLWKRRQDTKSDDEHREEQQVPRGETAVRATGGRRMRRRPAAGACSSRAVEEIVESSGDESEDEVGAGESYEAKASRKKEKKRQEREAQRQAEEAARGSRHTEQDQYAEMRRRKDEEREAVIFGAQTYQTGGFLSGYNNYKNSLPPFTRSSFLKPQNSSFSSLPINKMAQAAEAQSDTVKVQELATKIPKLLENSNNGRQQALPTSFLKVKKLSEKAVLPTRGSPLSAGYDLSSAAETKVPARGKALVPTDLSIAIPEGTYGRVAPRSGLAWKNGIDVGAGVIDADYRGPVGVILFNHSDVDFEVKEGDRIAQLIIDKMLTPVVFEVEDLDATTRGAGGFGSLLGFKKIYS